MKVGQTKGKDTVICGGRLAVEDYPDFARVAIC